MDTFAWLALAWLLLYLGVRYVGRWRAGRLGEPEEPTLAPPSEDNGSTIVVARPRIGSAPPAVVTMSPGAFAALVARRTRSRLRVRAASRASGASLRVSGYARRGGPLQAR